MELDDELCLCFHVTKRKVVNYLRVEKPRRVGELSHCFGAGTGCGWCRPYLQRLFQRHQQGQLEWTAPGAEDDFPTAEWYAGARENYLEQDHDPKP
jgi:bacterioferritin-associated ferredoxin